MPGFRFGLGGLVVLLLAAMTSAQQRGAVPATSYGTSWALVVGINNYRHADRLNYAVNDARAVAQVLPSLGFQQVRLLLDAEATKPAIEKIIYGEFKEKMGPTDRLFVFFAGHGITVKLPKGGEEGYLVPVDGDRRRPELTAIPMDEVRKMGKRVNARHIFFAIDSCFSGFAVARDIKPEAVGSVNPASALKEPVVQVLTAGRSGQRAYEEGGHGVFTKRLLEGLRGLADRDRRGFITVSQLYAWVAPRVSQDSGGRQHPLYSPLDGEGDFVFFLSPPDPVAAATQLEIEKRAVEEERRRLERLRKETEEQRRLKEEQDRLATERRRIEEQRRRLEATLPPESPTTGAWLGPGSTKQDALGVLGTPDKVSLGAAGREWWYYGGAQLTLRDGRIREWTDARRLKISMGRVTDPNGHLTRGSTAAEVIAVLGTPHRVSLGAAGREWWYYDGAQLTLRDGRVSEWTNARR